jgi:hypothetical protein
VKRVVDLGHVLDADGIRPVESKVQAIVDLPLPDSLKALKGFLGMAGYYRKFIQNFAHLSGPLMDMQKRGVVFEWSLERVAAFEAIKQALVSAPCLAAPRQTWILSLPQTGRVLPLVLCCHKLTL